MSSAGEAIYAALGDEWITTKALAEATGRSMQRVRVCMTSYWRSGLVERGTAPTPGGRVTFLWRRRP